MVCQWDTEKMLWKRCTASFLTKKPEQECQKIKKKTEKMCGPLLVCPADVFIIQTLENKQ